MKTRSKSSGACSFEVLGFPCNQFGHQEPGESAAEIMNGVKYVRPGEGFVPAFQLFEKGDVNGEKENPMFTYLKRHCPLPGGFIAAKASSIYWSPVRNDDIHWNFEKFLVDHTGRVRKRFLSSVSPFEIKGEIQQLLDDCERGQSSDDSFYDYYSK